jgi:hypothetical protein
MKFDNTCIELNRSDSHLLGFPQQKEFSWSQLTVLREITQLALRAELGREFEYVEKVYSDLDIAILSAANKRFRTTELAEMKNCVDDLSPAYRSGTVAYGM